SRNKSKKSVDSKLHGGWALAAPGSRYRLEDGSLEARMIKTACISAFLAMASAAWAQDSAEPVTLFESAEIRVPASLEEQQTTEYVPARGTEADFGISAAAHLRFVVPFGSADRETAFISGPGGAVVGIDQHLSWLDLFDPGWGGDLEVDIW